MRRVLLLAFAVLLLLGVRLGGDLPATRAAPPVHRPDQPEPATLSLLPPSTSVSQRTAANPLPWSLIVFESYRDLNWEIYSAADDPLLRTRLTDHPAEDRRARLNRGATRIVFDSNRTGNFQIYSMNADGTALQRLTTNPYDDTNAAWSPDGTRIVFQRVVEGQAEIFVMNADGSGQTRLTWERAYDGEPAWSPDGSLVAFTSKRSGEYCIWVMDAAGGHVRQLSTQVNSEHVAWSPDGTQLAYDADGDGDNLQELWLMQADGTQQRQVFKPQQAYSSAWARSWSPDGRYLAYTRVAYLNLQGNWYTLGYLEAWDSQAPDTSLPLTLTGLDWKPDWQSMDIWPPTSHVNPLPSLAPARIEVTWSGSDRGPSGLWSYDVQVRVGDAPWADWQMGTSATSAALAGLGGQSYAFRSRARDGAGNVEAWPEEADAVTRVEDLPPVSVFAPLPPYVRGVAELRWAGHDVGGSGIAAYDLQIQEAPTGGWRPWLTATRAISATFGGLAGQTYAWRVRATDMAGSVQPWPDAAQASTTFYTWSLTGTVRDNRATPLAGIVASVVPSALASLPSTAGGEYAVYAAAASGAYTVTWNRAGYGSLPGVTLDAALEARHDAFLPPADDVVRNGGLERGNLEGWVTGGAVTPTVVAGAGHSGRYALRLATAAGASSLCAVSQTFTLPLTLSAPTLSLLYQLGGAGGATFTVRVADGLSTTLLYASSAGTPDWNHIWYDLSAWAGKTLTLTVALSPQPPPAGAGGRAGNGSAAWAIVDEVSVGSSYPDVWVETEAEQAVLPGQTLTYTLRYGNRGGVAASGVRLTETLPASLAGAGGTTRAWELGPLPSRSGPFSLVLKARVALTQALLSQLARGARIAADGREVELGNNLAHSRLHIERRLYLPLLTRWRLEVTE